MRCTSCDAENKADALFCRTCGTPLKKCAHCDVLSENDALYCRRCGKPLGVSSEAAAEVLEDSASEETLLRRVVPNPSPKVDFHTSHPKPVVPLSKADASRRVLKVACVVVAVLVLASIAALVLLRRPVAPAPESAQQVRLPEAAVAVQPPSVPDAAPQDQHTAPAIEQKPQPEDTAAAQNNESLIAQEVRKLDEVKNARLKEEERLRQVRKEIARSGRNVKELRKEESALKSSIKARQKEEAALTTNIQDLRYEEAALKKSINGLRKEEAALKGSVNRRKAQQEAATKSKGKATKTPAVAVNKRGGGRQGRRTNTAE